MEPTNRSLARRIVEGLFGLLVLGLVGAVFFAMDGGGSDPVAAAPAPDLAAAPAADLVADVPAESSPVVPSTSVAWITSPSAADRRLATVEATAEEASRTVTVDLADRRQTWVGAGAALTESASALLADNDAALAALFGSLDGARLNLVRLPLSATDFSQDAWTWEWDASTGEVAAPAEAIRSLDVLDEIGTLVGADLAVAAAAWSAPADMVEDSSLAAGREGEYARMMAAQAEWLVERGVALEWLSLGNEPGHASDYPTMVIDDDQLASLAVEAAPALDALDVDLLAVDHNWDDRERVDNVMAAAPDAFDAAAFHCYAGEPEQMAGLDVPALVTECTGTTDTWEGTFAWDTRQLVERSIESGSTGLMMWNLALDPDHGPKADWGCSDCRGVITVDPATGEFVEGPEYFVLAHLARAAVPGSVVVGADAGDDIPVAAFQHADATVGVVGHNDSGKSQIVEIATSDGRSIRIAVGAGELFTVTL